MEIVTRDREGIRVLELRGKLNLESSVLLHDEVHAALDQGETQLLISLEGVSTIDSTGVGQLVASLTSATNRGGALKLMKPTPKVRDVLVITEMDKVFEIFDDEDDAISSFRQQSPPAKEEADAVASASEDPSSDDEGGSPRSSQ